MRIGLAGTRFAGLDGVTLESKKVAQVLESLGHSVAWFGGRLDDEFAPGLEVPEAYFDTAANLEINGQIFGRESCSAAVLGEIEQSSRRLQDDLARFVGEHEVDVLMPQNASAIPMQVPLGVAIARYIRQTGMPALAHHHDFGWERKRFWPNAVEDLLEEAFPPRAPSCGHLVINSLAKVELSRRRGVEAHLLPNIMDFDTSPDEGEPARFLAAAGLAPSDIVLLQPTRMVPRKGIEDTLELARRLRNPAVKVVVTHPEPDEGNQYVEELAATADGLDVDFRVVPVGPGTGIDLGDAYAAANLVTYPSRLEGFGNALLEAFYYKRPLLVNRYPVYTADIRPHGVRAIEMDGDITDQIVDAAANWLSDPREWADAVESNYELGRRYFSYGVAAKVLDAALANVAR